MIAAIKHKDVVVRIDRHSRNFQPLILCGALSPVSHRFKPKGISANKNRGISSNRRTMRHEIPAHCGFQLR
jgi:hypothetical protein